jgi:hypothetical protein
VLGKYQIDPKQKPDLKSMDDPFYAALKVRVAESLAKQGIDPDKQRTASPLRVAYYSFISMCLLASGYGHIKVRVELSETRVNVPPQGRFRSMFLTISLFAGELCLLIFIWHLRLAHWCSWS